MDITNELRSLTQTLIPFIGSTLFVLICWIGWQVWVYRKQKARDQAIMTKLSDIEKQLQQHHKQYSVSIDSDVNEIGGTSVSVTAPSMGDCETLLHKYTSKTLLKANDDNGTEQLKRYTQ